MMRGKQFSYYVTDADWAGLIDCLRAKVRYDIYAMIYSDSLVNARLTYSEVKTTSDLSFGFTNAGNEEVFGRSFGLAIGRINEHILDVERSEVIEVSRSCIGIEGGARIIRSARMYYITKYQMDAVEHRKSDDFIACAAEIYRYSKQYLARGPKDYYYGKGALALRGAGEIEFVN